MLRKRGTEVAGFALYYCVRAVVAAAAARTRQRRQYGGHVQRVNGLHAALAQQHARISTAKQSLRCTCVCPSTYRTALLRRVSARGLLRMSASVYMHVVVKGYNYQEEVDLHCWLIFMLIFPQLAL